MELRFWRSPYLRRVNMKGLARGRVEAYFSEVSYIRTDFSPYVHRRVGR